MALDSLHDVENPEANHAMSNARATEATRKLTEPEVRWEMEDHR